MEKVGIIITMHWSDKIRPKGKDYILNLIATIEKYINFEYTIYVIDNESQYQIDFTNIKNLKYFRIENQSLKGLTGSWNRGLFEASKDNCKIMIVCNDDLEFNPSINTFVNYIDKDRDSERCVYGPLSDGVANHQRSDKAMNGVFTINSFIDRYPLNGFMFGMTNSHYKTYKFSEDEYFNINNKHNNGDGKWGGQEGQFVENQTKGGIFKILQFCWIKHFKERAWKTARSLYK